MFRNLLGLEPQGKSVELALDPRRGVDTLESSLVEQWLGDDVEVIDLGQPGRDQVIQPTTWHCAS